jgi:hypothetical protein
MRGAGVKNSDFFSIYEMTKHKIQNANIKYQNDNSEPKNPKSKIRNPKQIPNPESQCFKLLFGTWKIRI